MAKTDFFDDDLMEKHIDLSVEGMRSTDSSEEPARVMTRMDKHRSQVEGQVAQTSEELERLRLRQETLERERKALQSLRERQDEYEAVRDDMIEHLGQRIPLLEREEVRIEQVSELVSRTRSRFKEMLEEVEHLNAEQWSDDVIRDELGKALALLEETRMEYQKSIAKLDSVRDTMNTEPINGGSRVVKQADNTASDGILSFAYWLKVGLAISLPLMLFLILLAVVAFFVLREGIV